jgi:predicted phage terminase large subunit-like protein
MYPKAEIIRQAKLDGTGVSIAIETTGMQTSIYNDLIGEPELRGYVIINGKAQGDKFSRAMPWISRVEAGVFSMCEGPWNQAYIDECSVFKPDSDPHDDQVDATTVAYRAITGRNRYIRDWSDGAIVETLPKPVAGSTELYCSWAYYPDAFRGVSLSWDALTGVGHVIEIVQSKSIEALKVLNKKYKYSICDRIIYSDDMKSILSTLRKDGINMIPASELDIPGMAFLINRMLVLKTLKFVKGTEVLSGALSNWNVGEDPNPLVTALINILAEMRKRGVLKEDAPIKPYSKDRDKALKNILNPEPSDWIK